MAGKTIPIRFLGFTQVPNATSDDHRLSGDTRDLLVSMLRHKASWNITLQEIARRNGIRADKLARMLGELQITQYIWKLKHRDAVGQWGTTVLTCARPIDTADLDAAVQSAEEEFFDVRLIMPTAKAWEQYTKRMNGRYNQVKKDKGTRFAEKWARPWEEMTAQAWIPWADELPSQAPAFIAVAASIEAPEKVAVPSGDTVEEVPASGSVPEMPEEENRRSERCGVVPPLTENPRSETSNESARVSENPSSGASSGPSTESGFSRVSDDPGLIKKTATVGVTVVPPTVAPPLLSLRDAPLVEGERVTEPPVKEEEVPSATEDATPVAGDPSPDDPNLVWLPWRGVYAVPGPLDKTLLRGFADARARAAQEAQEGPSGGPGESSAPVADEAGPQAAERPEDGARSVAPKLTLRQNAIPESQSQEQVDKVVHMLCGFQRVTRGEALKISALAEEVMAGGWSLEQLRQELDQRYNPQLARLPGKVLGSVLKDLLGSSAEASRRGGSGLPPWCGRCNGGVEPGIGRERVVRDPQSGGESWCEDCHPAGIRARHDRERERRLED